MIGSILRIPLVFALLAGAQSYAASDDPAQTGAAVVSHKHRHPAHAAPPAAATAKPGAKTPPPPAVTPKPPVRPTPRPDEAPKPETKPAAHFVSLRPEKVYLRSGPGAEYPIQWVYVRKGLPVEVLANFDIWRKIRDQDGVEGWVHQGMLSAKRTALVVGPVRNLRHDAAVDSPTVAQLEPDVIVSISKCDASWCEVTAGEYEGWLERDALWGFEPGELIQ